MVSIKKVPLFLLFYSHIYYDKFWRKKLFILQYYYFLFFVKIFVLYYDEAISNINEENEMHFFIIVKGKCFFKYTSYYIYI